MFAVGAGSGLASDLIILSGTELASVNINLPILGDEADHLMVCGWNGFHTVQPRASQMALKGDKFSTTKNRTFRMTGPA